MLASHGSGAAGYTLRCPPTPIQPTCREIGQLTSVAAQCIDRQGLVQHLYEKTGVPVPDLQTLARTQVSADVQQLLASGDKTGAIKAYRAETNVDLPTASRIIESL